MTNPLYLIPRHKDYCLSFQFSIQKNLPITSEINNKIVQLVCQTKNKHQHRRRTITTFNDKRKT